MEAGSALTHAPSPTEHVVLVDARDRPVGSAEKLRAHQEGLLHRAFSVFVFNTDGHLLLQRRHPNKYHSGGLWSNTCCSHPRVDEPAAAAALRRLDEEMGFRCNLDYRFGFTYHAVLDNDLVEHEYDHVFVGTFDGHPVPDEHEVDDFRWIAPQQLLDEMQAQPEHFTYWFRLIAERVLRAKLAH